MEDYRQAFSRKRNPTRNHNAEEEEAQAIILGKSENGDEGDKVTPSSNAPKQKRAAELAVETPLPRRLMAGLICAVFPDAFSEGVLSPFLYFLVRDTGVAEHEDQIAKYVGLLQGVNYAASFLTSAPLGWLSDFVGRKPVFLLGLIGVSVGMSALGVAKSFTQALFARALIGLLNANSPTAKSALGDFTDDSNRPRGYALYGSVFGASLLVGPLAGGFLANPTENISLLFGNSSFLKLYPYALPCLFSALVSAIGAIGVISWFPSGRHSGNDAEYSTLSDTAVGIEDPARFRTTSTQAMRSEDERQKRKTANNAVLSSGDAFLGRPSLDLKFGHERWIDGDDEIDEWFQANAGFPDDPIHRFGSPLDSASPYGDSERDSDPVRRTLFQRQGPILTSPTGAGIQYPRGLLTCGTFTAVTCYILFALSFMILHTAIPLLCSTPTTRGGLGLGPRGASIPMACVGAAKIILQMLVYPVVEKRLNARYGRSAVFRWTSVALALMACLVPLSVNAREWMEGDTAMWGVMILSMGLLAVCDVFGYLGIIILITDAADPSRLGVTHGIAVTGSSLARMIGPTACGLLFTSSLETAYPIQLPILRPSEIPIGNTPTPSPILPSFSNPTFDPSTFTIATSVLSLGPSVTFYFSAIVALLAALVSFGLVNSGRKNGIQYSRANGTDIEWDGAGVEIGMEELGR